MKITDIKTFPVWIGRRNQMVVKVETDDGVHGWGEAGICGRELAVDGAVNHYRRFLLGRDPMGIGALWQEMYRSQYFEGGRITVPDEPGLGVELNEELVAEASFKFWEAPHWRRRDGSHTNW